MSFLCRRVCLLPLFFAAVFCSGEEDPRLSDLLDRYEASRGGLLKLEALGALKVEGMTRQQEQVYSFTLYKKRPGLLRFQMERGEDSILLGFDGRTAWKSVQQGREQVTETLGPEDVERLRTEGALHDPLARALETYAREVRYLGEESVDGRRVHLIQADGPGKRRSIYHLDVFSLDVVRCESFDSRGGQLLETLFEDYRVVDGYRFAFEIENRIDGEPVSLTRLTSIEVNPGVLNFYFRPPAE